MGNYKKGDICALTTDDHTGYDKGQKFIIDIVHESGVYTTRGGYTVTEDEMELHQRTLGDSEIGSTDLAGVKQLYQDGISVEEIASTYLTTPDEIVCITRTWKNG